MWKNYTVYVFFLSVYSNKAILVDRCRLAEKVADVLEGVLKALFDIFASLFNILVWITARWNKCEHIVFLNYFKYRNQFKISVFSKKNYLGKKHSFFNNIKNY